MSERIYLSPPDMSAAEREALLAAFDSNWIAPLGPEVDAFEHDLAARVGVQDAAALSSGTAALHLALILLEVGPGDEVWTATLTFAVDRQRDPIRRGDPGVHRQRARKLEHGPRATSRGAGRSLY